MIAKIYSATPHGFEGKIIEVEANLSNGLPLFNLVGMGDKTILESKDRVRSAIVNSDLSFPKQKITVNLAPANFIKSGSAFDLPIAVSILTISKQLSSLNTKNKLFIGELSLDGSVRSVQGVINIIEIAKSIGITEIFLPATNFPSASVIKGIKLFPVESLRQLFLHLAHQQQITIYSNFTKNTLDSSISNAPKNSLSSSDPKLSDNSIYNFPSTLSKTMKNKQNASYDITFDDICGHDFAKRAIMLAIAGHHNLLLSGPPGSGKTLLSKAAQSLLPPPSYQEYIDIIKINELRCESPRNDGRPFRSPHHSSSTCAIIGGGSPILPGEISLANHGILFLDELPEFSHQVIESLRQPLEDHKITISRAKEKVTFPANFILLATMNPCPCGFSSSRFKQCVCTSNQIQKYRKKISGPILDRIDIKVYIPYLGNQEIIQKVQLSSTAPSSFASKDNSSLNTTKNLQKKIQEVVKKQYFRYQNFPVHFLPYNGCLKFSQLTSYIHLDKSASHVIELASKKFNFSTRTLTKIIRLSRTIADFDNSDFVMDKHISEAISFNQPQTN